MADIKDLSEREREILYLVAQGASNKQIAQELYISTNTVKVHLRNIFSKIGVSSRTEAAMFAVGAGLVEPVSDEESGSSRIAVDGAESTRGSTALFGLSANRRWISLLLVLIILIVAVLSVLLLLRDQIFPGQPLAEESLKWQTNAPLPMARSGFGAVAYEGQIYVIAGESDQGVTGIVERYDPSFDEWIILSSKPVPVTDINAVVLGGKIFVPGGRLESGKLTDVLEVYDPIEDKWVQYASLPFAIHAYSLVAFEGELILFGGSNETSPLNVVLSYDPEIDEWEEMTPLPTARAYSGAVVSGNKIHVIGGYDGKVALDVNEIYFPERDIPGTDPWSEGTPMPGGRYGMGVVSIADTIFVLGGESSDENLNQTLQYSSQEQEWRLFSNPDSETWSFLGLIRIETELYAIGGLLNNQYTDRNLSYKAIYTINLPLIQSGDY